jgi:hypothetical protein
LLDLSTATLYVSALLSILLNRPEADPAVRHGPHVIGPWIAVGTGKPTSIGTVADRLVLVAHLPTEHPHLISASRGRLTAPDLSSVDEKFFDVFKNLVLFDFQHPDRGADYTRKLHRLAEALTAALGEHVAVEPPETLPARAALWDVETGRLPPESVWSLPGSSRPVLVGETLAGTPFLVLAGGEGRASILKAGSPDPVELSWMSSATRPVLSRWRGLPVIVKGSLDSIEVVDPATGAEVGRFSGHLDEETLMASVEAEGGRPLVASVGKLGSRGRFSTSITGIASRSPASSPMGRGSRCAWDSTVRSPSTLPDPGSPMTRAARRSSVRSEKIGRRW